MLLSDNFRLKLYSKIGRIVRRFASVLPLIDRPELEQMALLAPEESVIGHVGYFHRFELSSEELAVVASNSSNSETYVPPNIAACFRDVRLIGKFGIPVTRRGKIVVAPFLLDWFCVKILPQTLVELGIFRFSWQYFLAIFPFFDLKKDPDAAATLFHLIPRVANKAASGNGAQYGHWMVESLSHLLLVRGLIGKIGPNFRLLLNSEIDDFQFQSLRLMGLSDLPISKIRRDGRRVKKLYVPNVKSFHSKSSEVDPRVRAWIRKQLVQGASRERARSLAQSLFISRQNMSDRRLANIEHVRAIVKEFGAVEFETGVLSMEEEVILLRDTKVLIGVTGSALVKMLFMPSLRHLILLQHPEKLSHVAIARLAKELGVDCTVLLCSWAQTEHTDPYGDLLAPELELRKALSSLRYLIT